MVTDRLEEPRDPFDALGDPHRRQILTLLGDAPRSVGALALELPISRPAVSRHLRLLKEAGLVEEEARGTRRIYRVNQAGLIAVRDYLDRFWETALDNFAILAAADAEETRRNSGEHR